MNKYEQTGRRDAAKDYLYGYRRASRAIRALEDQLTEVRLNKASPSGISYDGMPKAHGGVSDLSGYAARVDDLERRLKEEYAKRLDVLDDICTRINAMSSDEEKLVLSMHYIKGDRIDQIADAMSYSVRTILRMHAKALDDFPLPEA